MPSLGHDNADANDAVDANSETRGPDEDGKKNAGYNAVLLQQSSVGDVYMQRVLIYAQGSDDHPDRYSGIGPVVDMR